jgi:isorenieratene synthase
VAGTRVAIIGAGVAGLSAAVELTSRGHEVVVLDKGDRAGGRLSAWRDADGDTVEHGVHGWWHQYFNFFALMEKVGVDDDAFLLEAFPSAMVFEDGARVDLRWLDRRYPTPLYLLALVAQLRRLTPADVALSFRALLNLFGFRHARDFARYDHLSMYAYLERLGATRRMHELMMSPFARSFGFSSTEKLSAGAVMSALSFYLVGHQDDVKARWCRGNPQELVIDPLVRFVEARGGRVACGSEVRQLELAEAADGGPARVAAALVGRPGPDRELRLPLASIPTTAPPLVLDGGPEGRLLVRRAGERVIALSARCTHQGCLVAYDPSGSYLCPCHGGRFDLDGAVLQPPPAARLQSLRTRVEAGDAVIELGQGAQRVEADHFVVATDVESAKRLFAAEPAMLREPVIRELFNLEATGVIVARMWLDKDVPPTLTCGVFTGLGLLDNFFVLSNFQDEFASVEGSVVEVQMYVVEDYIHLDDDELREAVLEELVQRIPELRGAVVRKWAVNRLFDVFSHFNVGTHSSRPGVRSPYANLHLAGDWLDVEEPWWMMERSVVTGKQAANAILETAGGAPGEILRPTPDELATRAIKAATAASLTSIRALERVLGVQQLAP